MLLFTKTSIKGILAILVLFTNSLYGQSQAALTILNRQPLTGLQTFASTGNETIITTEAQSIMANSGNAVDTPMIRLMLNDTAYVAPEKYKTRIPQALIAPAILIIYGLTTVGNSGLYSSRQARKDLLNFTKGKGGPIDDYLIVSPYIEFGALLLFKVQCRNDLVNTTLLIAKSELLMFAITYPLKYIIGEERPYSYQQGVDGVPLEERKKSSSAFQSMPSGHTAEAFVAATVVYREYRYLSPWYGIGAYTLATTVGVFRMINDKHWESDVLVGAGIGMLATNIVYATHQHRWGRNEVCFVPMYDGQSKGLLFSYKF